MVRRVRRVRDCGKAAGRRGASLYVLKYDGSVLAKEMYDGLRNGKYSSFKSKCQTKNHLTFSPAKNFLVFVGS